MSTISKVYFGITLIVVVIAYLASNVEAKAESSDSIAPSLSPG